MRKHDRLLPFLGAIFAILTPALKADVSVPTLFSDHMVLQRDKPVKIWGWADPGEPVTVAMQGNKAGTVANGDGDWSATLPAMPAGGPYTMTVKGHNELIFSDVLLGEVWIASGQSNMGMTVGRSHNADLNRLTAKRSPVIRFNPIRNMGSQTPQKETTHTWQLAEPGTVSSFSAVAYAFAETLHDVLGVPIGIIENAWGASNAETWVARSVIAADPQLKNIHEQWLETEAAYDFEAEMAAYEKALVKWEEKVARTTDWKKPRKPRKPVDRMTAQRRPGNLWNGRVLPIAPLTVRGVIWYQGEGNSHTVERALQYQHLFSTMITKWRELWNEEFPFYFVQLADFKEESAFGENESWAYLRESQTGTMQTLPKTGQAVITDLGEGNDIHPRRKEEVGRRLARWALNKDYGFSELAFRSPEYDSWEQDGNQIVVNFNYTGKGLRANDTNTVHGFTVQSDDGQWHVVEGEISGTNSVTLDVPEGSSISAVRYAWANNPICNLFSMEGLPATSFRSDRD